MLSFRKTSMHPFNQACNQYFAKFGGRIFEPKVKIFQRLTDGGLRFETPAAGGQNRSSIFAIFQKKAILTSFT